MNRYASEREREKEQKFRRCSTVYYFECYRSNDCTDTNVLWSTTHCDNIRMKIVSHDASRGNTRRVDKTITPVVEFSMTGSILDSRYDEVNGGRERAHAKASRVATLRREVERDRCKGSEVRRSCVRVYTIRHCSRLARNCRPRVNAIPDLPFQAKDLAQVLSLSSPHHTGTP